MTDHEFKEIYDRLYKLSESLKETVQIVKKLESQETYDVDVDEDGPFLVPKITDFGGDSGVDADYVYEQDQINETEDIRVTSSTNRSRGPSPVPGGTEDN